MTLFIVAADKFEKYPIGVASRPEEVRKIVEADWRGREEDGSVNLTEYWVIPTTVNALIPTDRNWTPLKEFYEQHP